jgi:hypothetical protein
MKMIDDEVSGSPPPISQKKQIEFKCSHWCVHRQHGLGMIGEMAPVVSFHIADSKGELRSDTVAVDLADLRLASPSELPARLGYTPEQLRDFGYMA